MAVTYVTGPLSGDSLEKRSTNIPPQLKLILVKGRLGNQAFEDMERVHWADPQWVIDGGGGQKGKNCSKILFWTPDRPKSNLKDSVKPGPNCRFPIAVKVLFSEMDLILWVHRLGVSFKGPPSLIRLGRRRADTFELPSPSLCKCIFQPNKYPGIPEERRNQQNNASLYSD
ncbi:hypothetical protein TNIN_427091 [Trichonephila inaurata madagascariensis]|uniref:Uncharacterized protein n=1 Tax=Trichonephila inaurata madagascariensis TaxID=2747483 RepID=A0A8X6XGC0_9ARAC|nr:hypothetical protein TNIN_427091 [Trichonephila inaurata madagascariensis]